MTSNDIKVAFLLADYGHDPTETAIPYQAFKRAGFSVSFLTEHGQTPRCDRLMLTGWTQKLLGAERAALAAYEGMTKSAEWQRPLAWSGAGASLLAYDLVFLPGGHDKGVRQVLDSAAAHRLLAEYWPSVRAPGRKSCAAICHGVQVLAHATQSAGGDSLLHHVRTTALPGRFENMAYWATRAFLGDYYKTYGAGTDNVEQIVRKTLRDEGEQWRSSTSMSEPFVVENEDYNYISGRWPGDAQLLAEKTVEMVRKACAAAV